MGFRAGLERGFEFRAGLEPGAPRGKAHARRVRSAKLSGHWGVGEIRVDAGGP
jgi:hypothetical protein